MEFESLENRIGAGILTYVMSPLIIVGLVGNALSFLVYSRPFFAKSSVGFYLRTLAITDSITDIAYIFSVLMNGLHIDIKNYSMSACKIIWYLLFLPSACSAWIETLISVDRMLNIVAPTRFNIMKTRAFAYSSMAFILAANIALYAPILHFFQLVSNSDTSDLDQLGENTTTNATYETSSDLSCYCVSSTFYNIFSWVDLFNSTIVTCFIMIVCTVIMLSKLFNSRRNMNRRAHANGNKSQQNASAKQRDQRDRQFAITSISICVLFFVLNIGITVVNLMSTYGLVADKDYSLLISLTLVIFGADYCIKFFVYLTVNKKFLSEFKEMILCGKNEGNGKRTVITKL